MRHGLANRPLGLGLGYLDLGLGYLDHRLGSAELCCRYSLFTTPVFLKVLAVASAVPLPLTFLFRHVAPERLSEIFFSFF